MTGFDRQSSGESLEPGELPMVPDMRWYYGLRIYRLLILGPVAWVSGKYAEIMINRDANKLRREVSRAD